MTTEWAQKHTPPTLPPAATGWTLCARIEAESDAHVCWIHGLPGSGKTSGVRRWAEHCERSVLWYRVDPRDQDPLYTARSLRRLFAGAHDPGADHFAQGIQTRLLDLWEPLLDELDLRLPEPVWLVIDGLDLTEQLHRHPVWSSLFSRHRSKVRLLVTSRKPVPAAWSRWLVNREITAIGPEALRFTLADAKAWMDRWRVDNVAADDHALERMLAQSGGWGAGFEYILRRSVSTDAPAPALHEVWDHMQERLAQGSLRPDMDHWTLLGALGRMARVGDELVRSVDPSCVCRGVLLAWAERGLMVQLEEHQDQRIYCFHPMFTEVLCVAGSVNPPDADQYAALAGALVEHGQPLEALRILGREGRWDRFLQLLDDCAESLCDDPRLGALAPVLRVLPDQAVSAEQRGWIQILEGVCNLCTDHTYSLACIRRGLQEARVDLEWRAVALCSLTQHAVQRSNPSALLGHIDALDELLNAVSAPNVLGASRRLELELSGLLCVMMADPHHPRQTTWLQAVLSSPAQLFGAPKHALMASALVKRYVLAGWLDPAREIYNALLWSDTPNHSSATRIAVQMAGLFIDLSSGAYTDMLQRAETIEDLLEQQATDFWRLEVYLISAFVALCVGDRARVERYTSRLAGQAAATSPLRGMQSPLAKILAGLAGGDAWLSLEGQRGFVQAADRLGYCHHQTSSRAIAALSLLEQGQLGDAGHYVRDAQILNDFFGTPSSYWNCSLVHGYAALQRGDHAECALHLRDVFGQMRQQACYFSVLHHHEAFADLLAFALDADIERSFLIELIRRTRKYQSTQRSVHWPVKYELRVLGGFSLRVDGQDKTGNFRQLANRFEILTALVWLGGRAVDEKELMNAVWGDKRCELRSRLRQALRRLSQSLGRSDALLYDQGLVSLNPSLWRLDTWDLDARIELLAGGLEPLNPVQAQREAMAIERQLERGFVGPTPVPLTLRVAQNGRQLGPPSLLQKFARTASASTAVLARQA